MRSRILRASILAVTGLLLPLLLIDLVSGWVLAFVVLLFAGAAGATLMNTEHASSSFAVDRRLLAVVDVGFVVAIVGAVIGSVPLLVLGAAGQLVATVGVWLMDRRFTSS